MKRDRTSPKYLGRFSRLFMFLETIHKIGVFIVNVLLVHWEVLDMVHLVQF